MMCDYSDEIDYKCPHESLVDSDYCIFHLKHDNKNVDEFNSGINEFLEKEENSIDFGGFYFPPGTDNFTNICFQKNVILKNATFSDQADFEGANFSALFHVAAVHPHCRRSDTGIACKGHRHQCKKLNC